ncbi:MAG: hypothetical protein ACYDG2_18480 [Ruminiclostridium sp.]
MDGAQKQKGLQDFINYCMEERLEQLEEQFKDEEYEALEKRNRFLFKKLNEHLPEDLKNCIREYEDNASSLCIITERHYYKAGFRDSRDLFNLAFGMNILERNL